MKIKELIIIEIKNSRLRLDSIKQNLGNQSSRYMKSPGSSVG